MCLRDVCDEAFDKQRKKILEETEFVPQIGIITALGVELKSIIHILCETRSDIKREDDSPYEEYHHGIIKSNHDGGEHKVVVALCGKGNIKAAVHADALMKRYPTIKEIFMIGVAAGVPNVEDAMQHVRLGDIVVCNEYGVIQWDMVKRYTRKTEYVPPLLPPSYALLTRVANHIALMKKEPPYWSYLDEILKCERIVRPRIAPLKDTPWIKDSHAIRQPVLRGHDPKRPRIHQSPIASANTVLKSAKIRDRLRDKFKIKAVEMEASGIAEATWKSGKGYFVIRGICDFANDDKNKVWQPYAAAAAAAFTRELIETMPLTSESKKGS